MMACLCPVKHKLPELRHAIDLQQRKIWQGRLQQPCTFLVRAHLVALDCCKALQLSMLKMEPALRLQDRHVALLGMLVELLVERLAEPSTCAPTAPIGSASHDQICCAGKLA